MIDTGNLGSEKNILKKMTQEGIDHKDLQLIVITHGHSDHFGASCALRKKTGAKVAIHCDDSNSIRTGTNVEMKPTNRMGKIFRMFLPKNVKSFSPFEPDIIIEKELSLDEYGIDGKIILTPGHTNGSISILLNNGYAFVGDLIMGGMMGKGKANFPIYAQDLEGAKRSISHIIKQSPKMIYTGHGGPFTIEEVKQRLA